MGDLPSDRPHIEIKVVGGHNPASLPDGFADWLSGKLALAGFTMQNNGVATLRKALPGTSANKDILHATRVDGNAVVIQGQCGNNNTRRELFLRMEGIDPKNVLEMIRNRYHIEKHPVFAAATGAIEPLDKENLWFPVDEENTTLYLIGLFEDGYGVEGERRFSLSTAKKVLRGLIQMPRGKWGHEEEAVLYLLSEKLIELLPDRSKRNRQVYRFTPVALERIGPHTKDKVAEKPAAKPAEPTLAQPVEKKAVKKPETHSHENAGLDALVARAIALGDLAKKLKPHLSSLEKIATLDLERTRHLRAAKRKKEEIIEAAKELPNPELYKEYCEFLRMQSGLSGPTPEK